jgi:hypothetical protein
LAVAGSTRITTFWTNIIICVTPGSTTPSLVNDFILWLKSRTGLYDSWDKRLDVFLHVTSREPGAMIACKEMGGFWAREEVRAGCVVISESSSSATPFKRSWLLFALWE